MTKIYINGGEVPETVCILALLGGALYALKNLYYAGSYAKDKSVEAYRKVKEVMESEKQAKQRLQADVSDIKEKVNTLINRN